MRASDKYNGFYSPPNLSVSQRKRVAQSLSPTEDPDVIAANRESAIRRSQEWKYNVIASPLYDKKRVPRSFTFTKGQTSGQNRLAPMERKALSISIEDQQSSGSRDWPQLVQKRPVYQESALRGFANDFPKRKLAPSELIPEPPVEFQTDSIEDLSLDFSTDDKLIKKNIPKTKCQVMGTIKRESSGSDLDRKTPQLFNGLTLNPKSAITSPTPSISSHSLILNDTVNGTRTECKGVKAESQLRMNKSFPSSISPQSVIYDLAAPFNDGYATIVKGESTRVIDVS
ncbi:hypothetical protein Ciccas_012850 [Cichlidogyrus casuarinus]|uniref:Exophilin 5 n=1 Tax=Cichlidogyrus casuarinus TaxID=1844966 RepID=A0ABD2PM59_9PLAT